MKFGICVISFLFVMFVVGFVNAGSSPSRRAFRTFGSGGGCAGQVTYSYAATSGGCHSSPMIQPAYSDCGCVGGRITMSERSQARRAARENYDRTHRAFLAAAAKGELVDPVAGPELTTMKAVPVVEVVEEEDDCPICEKAKLK